MIRKRSRRWSLAMLILSTTCVLLPCRPGLTDEQNTDSDKSANGRPNIVVILADDLGYGDLKAYNAESRIETPYLDRLAASGIVFTDAHSGGSTCVPSRHALITGRFAARRGRLNVKSGPLIGDDQVTFASMLRKQGYRTAMVGKWHQGFHMQKPGVFDYGQPLTGGPVDCGFDSFFGMHASLDIPPYFYIRDRRPVMVPVGTVAARTSVGGPQNWNRIQGAFWREGRVAPDFHHSEVTPRFADEAVQVIRTHQGTAPLFLYLALPSPHTPWLPAAKFVGKSGAGLYGDFVMQVDEVVGQVLDSLEEANMADNTLVLFTSDNGPVWYSKDTERFGHRATGPLRGIKGSVWEGGHRMPFIARWPDRVPAGKTSGHTIAFADVLATFAEISGHRRLSLDTTEDSVSFLPVLLNPDDDHKPRPALLHGDRVIRDGDWKLITTRGNRGFGADRDVRYGIELYNLRKDPGEQNNLADSMPHKVRTLQEKLSRILEPTTTASASSLDWTELFNGRDLKNWKANMHPEAFTVENGQLKVHGRTGMAHLFYVDDSGRDMAFINFELEVISRSEPNSNSGIFFHTDRSLRKGKYLNKGYEVQLNSAQKEKRKTGSLYGIVDVATSPVDETDWFRMHLRVEGKRIQISIDDTCIVDYTEPDNPERQTSRAERLIDVHGGGIAIQAHDPGSIFYFKRIRIRRLDQPR